MERGRERKIPSEMVLFDPLSDQCSGLSKATASCFPLSPFEIPQQLYRYRCANSPAAAACSQEVKEMAPTSYRRYSCCESTCTVGQGAAMKCTGGNWGWILSSPQVSPKLSKSFLVEKICKAECA